MIVTAFFVIGSMLWFGCSSLLGRRQHVLNPNKRLLFTVVYFGPDAEKAAADRNLATLSANSSCNEPDMSPVTTDDGEDIRLIETIPDPSPNPAQILLHNEHTAEVDHIQNAFEASLAQDRPLKSLFRSFRRGLTTPWALARKLRRTPPAIRNLQKRLKRKWTQFVNHQSCAEIQNLRKKA